MNYCKFPGKFTLSVVICEVGLLILFGFFVRYDDYGMTREEHRLTGPLSSTRLPQTTVGLNSTTNTTIGDISSNKSEDHKSPAKQIEVQTGNKYEDHVEHYYPMFQDIHIMMFIGFGFLMTFLKRYGFSSVGLNFLVAAFVLQWQTIIHGWIDHFDVTELIQVNVKSIIKADFAAAAILISFGAVLGKVSPIQLLIMAACEVVVYEGNQRIVFGYLNASDAGDSMVVHAFGAYFGLMVAWVLYSKETHEAEEKESSVYQSDIFAMIGTLFLWVCWPSFNAGTAVNQGRVRAIINTYYALTASCVTTFAISSLVDKKNRFNMVHIQNATLAGAVGVGSVADMLIQPWAAILIGIVAGVVSVLGYRFLTPAMSKYLKLHDTCGVHNLHGMPGVISGLGSILAAGIATEELYGASGIEDIFGSGRTVNEQAGMQAACLGISLGLAIFGGLLTGAILRIPIFDQPRGDQIFDDEDYWIIPVSEDGAHDTYMDQVHTKV